MQHFNGRQLIDYSLFTAVNTSAQFTIWPLQIDINQSGRWKKKVPKSCAKTDSKQQGVFVLSLPFERHVAEKPVNWGIYCTSRVCSLKTSNILKQTSVCRFLRLTTVLFAGRWSAKKIKNGPKPEWRKSKTS